MYFLYNLVLLIEMISSVCFIDPLLVDFALSTVQQMIISLASQTLFIIIMF